MSSLRDELLAAIEAGDHQAVRRREWGEVWESLATIVAPKQGCTLTELRAYAWHLGNERPADVLEAIGACAGKWRPTPSDLKEYLNRKRGDSSRVDVGRGRDRSSTPEALAAVADAVRAGEQPCTCGPPTLRRWRVDVLGVWRCPDCGGLEQGQVNHAEDAGLLKEAA